MGSNKVSESFFHKRRGRMKWILVAIIFLLVGCSSSVNIVASSESLGGIQKEPKWGVVRYIGRSKGQQRLARNKMVKYCQPRPYKIVKIEKKEGSRTTMNPFLLFKREAGYIYLRFECVDPEEARKSKD